MLTYISNLFSQFHTSLSCPQVIAIVFSCCFFQEFKNLIILQYFAFFFLFFYFTVKSQLGALHVFGTFLQSFHHWKRLDLYLGNKPHILMFYRSMKLLQGSSKWMESKGLVDLVSVYYTPIKYQTVQFIPGIYI